MDINAVNSALNSSTVKVSIVSLGGVDDYEITSGTTVRDLKNKYGLNDMKIVTADGSVLSDTDTISADTQLYISTPKRNG